MVITTFCSLFSNNLSITCLLLFSVVASTSGVDPEPEALKPNKTQNDVPALNKPPVILINNSASLNNNSIVKNETSLKDMHKSAQINNTEITIISPRTTDSGALYRFFLVSLGICALSVIYVSYRFYKTKNGSTRPTAVRKYGILTQRTDIEMLPLPLDDEEDDDTVFDVGNHVSNR